MKNCSSCFNNARCVVSENGIHYNCIFSNRKSTNCLMNNYKYYEERPKLDFDDCSIMPKVIETLGKGR